MRKFLSAFLIIMALSLTAHTQEMPDNSFRENNSLLQAGISFGYYGYGYVGNRTGFSVPLSLTYEKKFKNHISGGAFVGYANYSYKGYNDYEYGWTFLDFGARASYHYIHFLNNALDMEIDTEKYDFYLTLMLIFESRTYSASDDYYDDYYENDFDVSLGTVAGFRYHLNNKWSLFFEGGRGTFGYGTFGVTAYF